MLLNLWVVVGYEKGYHLSLIRLILSNNILDIQILDSIGLNPRNKNYSQYTNRLSHLITELTEIPGVESYKIHASSTPRQKDGANCFSFVLNDFETSEQYLSNGISHFFSSETSLPSGSELVFIKALLPDFYNISQLPHPHANMECKIAIGCNKRYGNPLALEKSIRSLSCLVETKMVTFSPENHVEEGLSEEDEQVDNCSIM